MKTFQKCTIYGWVKDEKGTSWAVIGGDLVRYRQFSARLVRFEPSDFPEIVAALKLHYPEAI